MSMSLAQHLSDQGVLTLTLSRPEQSNAFDDVLIADLTETLRNAEKDDQVRVLVLRGAGKHFCAGADLNWMKRMADYSQDENLADANRLAEMLATLNHLSKPTIAVTQGAVYGGGVGLVACCDLVLAQDNTRFCLSEVKLGLIPATIGPYLIQAMGAKHTRALGISARPFQASEAERYGLVQQVVSDDDELNTTLTTWIESLLSNSPEAMTRWKQLLGKLTPLTSEQQQLTSQAIAEARVSEQGQAGLAAFFQKQRPYWCAQNNKQ